MRKFLLGSTLFLGLVCWVCGALAQDPSSPVNHAPVTPVEWQLLGGAIIGWVVQKFARAPKNVPTWVGYAVIGVTGIAVYVFITPGFAKLLVSDWRSTVAGLVSFLFQIRGQAGASADAKIAPSVDTK